MNMMAALRRSLAATVLLVPVAHAAAQTVAIAPELWDRPRSGATILEQPAIQQAVRAYLQAPGAQLVIHHAAGQESMLYAEELRSWLIALALDPDRIAVRPDLPHGDPLKLELLQ